MQAIHFDIWAILIVLGAAQGLFLALFLIVKRENRKANRWLGALLAAMSLHLIEYTANLTGISLHYPVLIAITYPLLFCFGPFYYLYCRQLLGDTRLPVLKILLHFIVPFIVLLLLLPFYLMPAQEKAGMMGETIQTGIVKEQATQSIIIIMGVHIVQTLVYIFASSRFVRRKEQALKAFSSNAIVVKKTGWLNTFNIYLSAYFLLYFMVAILLGLQNSYNAIADYILLLTGAISIYVIGYAALNNPEILKSFPVPEPLPALNEPETPEPAITNNKYPELRETLLEYMEHSKPYLNSELKISQLAASLSISSHQLSELINSEFEVNFYDFINRYRVEEAKKLLLTNQSYKILVIGYEVGFNSKATFNRVFKKLTSYTPSEYKEQFLVLKQEE